MTTPPSSRTPLCVGIDFGTSGCRAVAVGSDGEVVGVAARPLPASTRHGRAVEQSPAAWTTALIELLTELFTRIEAEMVGALAVDATSGTVLLVDAADQPMSPALMYNDSRAVAEAERIAATAPRGSAAHGTASGLAKALWLLGQPRADQVAHIYTQTDFINRQLLGSCPATDANSALKLGYDPVAGRWPDWLTPLGIPPGLLLPVVAPGTPLGRVAPPLVARFGLSPDCVVAAGTTDSTAAFLATGAALPGEAVTSLGSTLVLKVLSERAVFAPEFGVYSQPLGDLWLVGGGSNSGGAVLRRYFSDRQMAQLTPQLNPREPTGLDYYPLLAAGERFPVNDPQLPPRLSPRPTDDLHFFQGMLEGMGHIERHGYERLAALGAPWPRSIRSVGGGAANLPWRQMRERILGIPLLPARQTEAAFGAALLARRARGWD